MAAMAMMVRMMRVMIIIDNSDDDDDDDCCNCHYHFLTVRKNKHMGLVKKTCQQIQCKIMMLSVDANTNIGVLFIIMSLVFKKESCDNAGQTYQYSKLLMATQLSPADSRTHNYPNCGNTQWVSDWSLTMPSMVASAETTWVTTFLRGSGSSSMRYLTGISLVRTQRHKHQDNNAWDLHSFGIPPHTLKNKHEIRSSLLETNVFPTKALLKMILVDFPFPKVGHVSSLQGSDRGQNGWNWFPPSSAATHPGLGVVRCKFNMTTYCKDRKYTFNLGCPPSQ